MTLIDEIARRLGLRNTDHHTEPTVLGAALIDMRGQMDKFEVRLATIERTVDDFVSVFEKKLDEFALRGAKAKQQAADGLEALRRDMDAYIDILEKAVEAQLDMARRQDIRRLLASARAKRTRITNVIALKAANDG